jgi:hypothetical protein
MCSRFTCLTSGFTTSSGWGFTVLFKLKGAQDVTSKRALHHSPLLQICFKDAIVGNQIVEASVPEDFFNGPCLLCPNPLSGGAEGGLCHSAAESASA